MKKYIITALILVSLACSHYSVKHLTRQPWIEGMQQSLDMKYWRFEYMPIRMPDQFGVKGRAYPIASALPAWGEWLQDLWISAYLCDQKGNVLAKDLKVYLPRKINYSDGIAFEFELKPEKLELTRPLYVTFGYRMELAENQYQTSSPLQSELTGDAPPIFFASQGALLR